MTVSLRGLEQDWQELGALDPLYAVLSHPDKKFGKWDKQAFFETGEREIASLMQRAKDFGVPHDHVVALDFGCGVGRLTQALANRFDRVIGVDISSSMIAQAKKIHAAMSSCAFIQNTTNDLTVFENNRFDLIYSSIVLQHIQSRNAVLVYLTEFVRVLKPGGILAFQIPVRIPWRACWQPQQRLYHLLHMIGISSTRLYRWHLLPISMNAINATVIRKTIEHAGGRILAEDLNTFSGRHVESRMFFVTKNEHVHLR